MDDMGLSLPTLCGAILGFTALFLAVTAAIVWWRDREA
jgi:hypothetical protein